MLAYLGQRLEIESSAARIYVGCSCLILLEMIIIL